MFQVQLQPRALADLAVVVPPARVFRLIEDVAPMMRVRLTGHDIINVNSTASGGGVSEMLHVLLPLCLGLGVPAPWYVMEADPEFFVTTKRIHNRLHGNRGDSGSLGEAERNQLQAVAEREAAALLERIRPGDVVILHDPQPVGMARILHEAGFPVIWRCHVGVDHHNDYTREVWNFLRPMLEGYVDGYVFTRESYVPDWVPADQLQIIKPAIDPLAAKNQELAETDVMGALVTAGILHGAAEPGAAFTRASGQSSPFDLVAEIQRSGEAPGPEVPIVLQVSRWDPLKDMAGVMRAFAEQIAPNGDAHLMLVGPSVAAVSDDPEGQQVLADCVALWRQLPAKTRERVHLISLPMTDPEQNGAVVNALQRHATVVVQKSLAEGFGLTVTEAMFKGKPVVAAAVGGIADQIVNDTSGLLIADATDLTAFGAAVNRLLADEELRSRLGTAARQRVVDQFLPDSSLDQWNAVVLSAMTRNREP
jgi:trehalose synthase